MGEKQLLNPQGAFGYSDTVDKLPQTIHEFKAGAAIDAKQVVVLQSAGTVIEAATDSTASLCVGISNEAAASGGTVSVVVYGICEDVPCDGSVSTSSVLKRSVTTTGSVAATASPATGESIGIGMTASASNLVDVYVTIGR